MKVKPGTPETSVKGVYAAGDVQDKDWRQVTCVGDALAKPYVPWSLFGRVLCRRHNVHRL